MANLSVTPHQHEAIFHKDGPMLVLAGPGAGKTFVITKRVCNLVQKEKIAPGKILVITFTVAAAKQMQKRYEKEVKEEERGVSFGTFHSLFFRILSESYGFLPEQILKDQVRKEIYAQIMSTLQFEVQDVYDFYQAVSTQIGRVKELLVYEDEKGKKALKRLEDFEVTCCPKKIFYDFYRMYEEKMQERGLIDFDDMGILCYELLKKRPDILKNYQDRFPYILVDEMQDTNILQYDIARMLAGPNENIMMVGDDDQSIYSFRGARPEIMLRFSKDFPKGKMILLDVNFRSVPEVVTHAKRLISHNEGRYPKQIVANRESFLYPDQKEAVNLKTVNTLAEQREYIIHEMKNLHKAGIGYEEMAILYRTNLQPQNLCLALGYEQIPYYIKEAMPSIYDHWIAKDIFAYLKLAYEYRFEDKRMSRASFLEVMNRPKRYIRRDSIHDYEVTFEGLADDYERQKYVLEKLGKFEHDLKVIGGFNRRDPLPPNKAISYIRKSIGYDEYIEDYAELRGLDKEELFMILDELMQSAEKCNTVDAWFDEIKKEKESLKAAKDERNKKEAAGVTLMTYHSAKGLEFGIVFLVDLVEGLTPYHKASTKEEIEEERRMFYVAMTRAKNRLYLIRPLERFGKSQVASRFLKEVFDITPDLQKGMLVNHKILGDAKVVDISKKSISIKLLSTGKTVKLNLEHCMENKLVSTK